MKTRLRSGAILHFIIAIGHVACLFFLEEAFKAYDILDEMTSMCFGHTWLLYALTITLALAFTVVGLYALSAAGDIKRLPLQRFVIIAIVVVYSIRAVLGLASLLWDFSWLNLFSSLTPALVAWCYLPGVTRNVLTKASNSSKNGIFTGCSFP